MKVLELEQGSLEWKRARLGKITGTRGKKAISSTHLDLIDEIIAEVETQEVEEIFENDAMRWGKEQEPNARKAYEYHTGLEIKEFGFFLHDSNEYLAISPDGYTDDLKGGIEIKCPTTKTHVKYIRMGKLPGEYKAQVFHNFIVNQELEWLDFVSYDPRFKSCQMFIKRVTREEIEEELADYEAELLKFIDKLEKYQKAVLA